MVSTNNTQQTTVITPTAHAKMMMHAVRHSRSVIHGILLGKYSAAGPRLTITDALPVCHAAPTKPLLDMALRLADAYCETSDDRGTAIVGWYTSNETAGDDAPGRAALKIVSSVAEIAAAGGSVPAGAEPVLAVITSAYLKSTLGPRSDASAGGGPHIYGSDGKKHWLNRYPDGAVVIDSPGIAADACRADRGDVPFFDFEDHLEGGAAAIQSRDWIRNSGVADFVQRSVV